MAEIRQGRWTARIEGDFVVFLIGTPHLAPWRAYSKRLGRSDRTGIWR
jgi:hypothetical protein